MSEKRMSLKGNSSKKKMLWTIGIVIVTLVAAGAITFNLLNLNSSSVEAPGPENTPAAQAAWEAMNIECDNLSFQDCKTTYEKNVSNNAKRVDTDQDQKIVAYLENIRDISISPEYAESSPNEILNIAAGWPADDASSLTNYFNTSFLNSLNTEGSFVFIGQPNDRYDDPTAYNDPSDSLGYTPITIISKELKVVSSGWFSYNILGEDTLVPCNPGTC